MFGVGFSDLLGGRNGEGAFAAPRAEIPVCRNLVRASWHAIKACRVFEESASRAPGSAPGNSKVAHTGCPAAFCAW